MKILLEMLKCNVEEDFEGLRMQLETSHATHGFQSEKDLVLNALSALFQKRAKKKKGKIFN